MHSRCRILSLEKNPSQHIDWSHIISLLALPRHADTVMVSPTGGYRLSATILNWELDWQKLAMYPRVHISSIVHTRIFLFLDFSFVLGYSYFHHQTLLLQHMVRIVRIVRIVHIVCTNTCSQYIWSLLAIAIVLRRSQRQELANSCAQKDRRFTEAEVSTQWFKFSA